MRVRIRRFKKLRCVWRAGVLRAVRSMIPAKLYALRQERLPTTSVWRSRLPSGRAIQEDREPLVNGLRFDLVSTA